MDIRDRVRESLDSHIGITSHSIAHRINIEPWRVRMALQEMLAKGEVSTSGSLDYIEWKLVA